MKVCCRVCGLLVAAAILPACYAEDSIDHICEESARSPTVLAVDQPNSVSLQLSCDEELTLSQWLLEVRRSSPGPPYGGNELIADRPTGRDFTLTGTYTPDSSSNLDEIRVLATDQRGVVDEIVEIDWESSP